MTEVATAAAQGSAQAARKTFWERIRPAWWMRGFLSAIALVGLMDHLGFVREDWLTVLHAFGARWNTWMSWVTDLITFQVDWIELTVGEGNILTLLGILGWPALFSLVHAVNEWTTSKTGQIAFLVCAGALSAAIVIVFLAPGDAANLSYHPLLTGLVGLPLAFFTIMLVLAAHTHGAYYRALFTVFSFLLTLEVFNMMPLVRDGLRPVIEWVDPGPP